jgi:hypothetical protein
VLYITHLLLVLGGTSDAGNITGNNLSLHAMQLAFYYLRGSFACLKPAYYARLT